MKYHISNEASYSIATITTPKSATALVYISVDLHASQSQKSAGASLLYSDMLLSGAGPYTRESFTDALNQLGASISVSISDGVATFAIRSLTTVLDKVLALFSVIIHEPTFAKSELLRTKTTVTNLLHECKEESRAIAQYELRNTMYGNEDRRFTHDEDALISTVSAVQAKDITSLHKAILESVWTCSIAGDTTTVQKVSNVIKKTKSKYKRLREQTGHHQQKPPNATLAIRDIPSRQNIDFSIGIPVPITLHHPDFAALNFGLAVLGKWGGFTGRLMSTVREQEGLTYGIYARTESFYGSEQGYWRIMTFFSPVQAILGLTSTYREITTLYRDGITESELIRFKNILATGQALLQDSPLSQLRDLHAYHQQGLNLQEIAEHKSKLHSLTLEEVNTAIKTYCDPSLLTISAAGPINKKMATELKTFLKSVS